ncbi:FAD-binding oxidoreductase [Nitratireductor basaltis]|uniref:FAD linked oxidase domain-containing protein n=1 Tax=Nitratireductor basaltis TaxID=472175 RepID=A0A084U635_9HYPH|nr:FAD-binding oxidoreductase [Nitratireductor basaltis]KFB08421.1 FAD linked oxidase domain-containing protein [Nitratireductor basaltis]
MSVAKPKADTLDAFFEACIGVVGPRHFLQDADAVKPYGRDWSGAYFRTPLAVALPSSTAEVSDLVRLCAGHGIPVVPAGGRTGLCGGSVPMRERAALVMSLERMTAIREMDRVGRTVTVEAGCILETLQDAVAEAGLAFPLMFGAKGSCMIGGALSTNAGGSNVLRYGNARDLCLGIEAVMPDGTVVNGLSALRKDNTGYDLRNLLIGAEGTLGIITAATLKTLPQPLVRTTAFLSVSDLDAALTVLHRVQDHTGGAVEAFEFMPQPVIDAICTYNPAIRSPLEGPAEIGILLEVASSRPMDAQLNEEGARALEVDVLTLLADLVEKELILDATIARNDQQRQDLWTMREMVLEGITHAGVAEIFDISLSLKHLSSFVATAKEQAARFGFRSLVIGHLGDGNLHYAVMGAEGQDPADLPMDAMRAAIMDEVARLNGSFSAEHGIGQSKLDQMLRYKDAGQLAVMRRIKSALDPQNLMNPGKLIPLASTEVGTGRSWQP